MVPNKSFCLLLTAKLLASAVLPIPHLTPELVILVLLFQEFSRLVPSGKNVRPQENCWTHGTLQNLVRLFFPGANPMSPATVYLWGVHVPPEEWGLGMAYVPVATPYSEPDSDLVLRRPRALQLMMSGVSYYLPLGLVLFWCVQACGEGGDLKSSFCFPLIPHVHFSSAALVSQICL